LIEVWWVPKYHFTEYSHIDGYGLLFQQAHPTMDHNL